MNKQEFTIESEGKPIEEITGEESALSKDNLSSTIKLLDNRTLKLKEDFNKLEKRQNVANSFMMTLTSIMAGVFLVTGLMVALDFFKYNNERHEKYINEISKVQLNLELNRNKIQEIEDDIINNDTVKKSEKIELENKINQQQGILDCLKGKRYWQYEQCFK